MATVTLVNDNNQQVKSDLLKKGQGIQEILYFPAIDPELGANENSDIVIQEVWVLEQKRLDKFLVETEKYNTAAQTLAEAKLKLADANTEVEIKAAKEEVTAAQDQMRDTLAKGFGKKSDDSVMPIPQGSTKKLIECIGLVNKRTHYISMHELKKVEDTKENGKRKFRFDTGEEYKDRKKQYLLEQFLTDSDEGKADDYKKEEKEVKKEEEKKKSKKNKNYVSEKWKKKFFKDIRSKIAKEWSFGNYETEGQLKIGKIGKHVKNDLVRKFLLNEENCELIDSYVGYLNDIANFSYQQKEQKLDAIKKLLSKSDDQFDHYDWGQVRLGVQQIWNATDRETVVESFEETYEDYPKKEEERATIISTLDAYKLPEIYFDASGGAQFMRYSANCGGIAKFSLENAKLSYKADAKFSLLEAGAEGNYYFPNNLGADLKFNAPIIGECFEPKQLTAQGKGYNNTDPTFAKNSSFVLPSAIIDIAQQLTGLMFLKKESEQQELLIQVAGHADSFEEASQEGGVSYWRANATHALFTDNKAQWREFFEKGIWSDEERDMIFLSIHMMKNHPTVFKERFENLEVGDKDNLGHILLEELKVATKNYDYPIQQIQNSAIRTEIRALEQEPISVEGKKNISIDIPLSMPKDEKLIEIYFQEMLDYALQNVSGLDKSAFQLFYIDTELHPILSYSAEQLGLDGAKEKEDNAADRIVKLIPWGVEKKSQPDTTQINLGIGRVCIHGQVTASVGATLGMAVDFELNTFKGASQLIAKKKKEDVVTEYKGKEIGPTQLGKQNATARANAGAFVGARAEAALSASLEWNNPDKPNVKFGILASVGGSLTGTAGAGIEGEFKIGWDQTTSTFQIKMKAVATWGLGGGGAWSFSVGVQQLFDFIKLVYYKLEENHFNFLDVFEDDKDKDGKLTESETNVYQLYTNWVGALWEEKDYIKASAAAAFGVNLLAAFDVLETINKALRERRETEMNEEKAQNLVNNIHANPSVLHFVPPEAKGSMLYKIITFKTQSWSEFFSTDWFKSAEDAALAIIFEISHWREWQETMEHLALNIDDKWLPYDKELAIRDRRSRFGRMNLNITYLRTKLLQNTKKWNMVREHISSLEGRDYAWNMNAMLWNTKKEKK